MGNPKIFQKGAMSLEAGSSTQEWGTDPELSLGLNDGFPWIEFGNSLEPNSQEDESIIGKGFKSTSRLIGLTVENSYSFYSRFKKINHLHYWMWGFENPVKNVFVFKSSSSDPWSSGEPDVGTVYEDPDSNKFVYLRTEKNRNETLYVFEGNTEPSDVDPIYSGDLMDPNSSETFSFSDRSDQLYEHIYELDSTIAVLRDFSTSEVNALGLSGSEKKNVMATFAKRLRQYDLKYSNTICSSFTYSLEAAGLGRWNGDYLSYKEQRSDNSGGFGSDSWSLPNELVNNQLVPAHYQSKFEIGDSVSNLNTLGLTNFELSVTKPYQKQQDTVSGLYIAEPVAEGKYDISASATISRHSVPTYQKYRDNQTPLVARMRAQYGWQSQEFLIKKATLTESGPDDSDVAQEPLSLSIGYITDSSNPWAEYMSYDDGTKSGVVEQTGLQDSPVVFRVRDSDPENKMTVNL